MTGEYTLVARRRPNNPTGAMLTGGHTCNNIAGSTIAGLDSGSDVDVTRVTATEAGRY